MITKKARTPIALAGIVLLLGCRSTLDTVPPSETDRPSASDFSNTANCTTPGGRRLHAYGNFVTVGVQREGEIVAVRLGEPQFDPAGKMTVDHTVTFGQEKVFLDGKERAKITASSKEFEVICTTNKLSVVVDKKLVWADRMDNWRRNRNGISGPTTMVR